VFWRSSNLTLVQQPTMLVAMVRWPCTPFLHLVHRLAAANRQLAIALCAPYLRLILHSVGQRAAIRADVEAAFSPRAGRAMLTSLGAPAKATAVGTRNAAGVAVDLDKVLTLVVKALSALLLVAVLAVAGLMVGSLFLASPGDVLVVQPGDTLWSIASTVTNAPDPSAVVADIRDLNNLGSDALTVGQSIELPAY